jgi:hypothetical protein
VQQASQPHAHGKRADAVLKILKNAEHLWDKFPLTCIGRKLFHPNNPRPFSR